MMFTRSIVISFYVLAIISLQSCALRSQAFKNLANKYSGHKNPYGASISKNLIVSTLMSPPDFSTSPLGATSSHCGVDPGSLFGPAGEDLVWEAMRRDAEIEASKEPLLASFMHGSILSHSSLEKALAFHLANLLSSPAMSSTQVQSLFLAATESSITFRISLRMDIKAVMERDPAVKTCPDVLLYFKGFQALQTHRVAHWLWSTGRPTLALFLHSRANNVFQIDIHPGAKIGNGVFIDHGTGVVIGETAIVGDNVSMLHKVTLGGSGIKKNTRRHPSVGSCCLLGAGATILGPITIGEGSHVGACSMVLEDIPPHSVAVGVPAKVIKMREGLVTTKEESPALRMETNYFYDI